MKTTNTPTMRAAMYARYSSDQQHATSLDDQLTRCKAIALHHGASIPDEFIFTDAAHTASQSLTTRSGFNALLAAIDAGAFKLLIADEQSRLFRNDEDDLRLKKAIKRMHVRVVTADGLDTANPSWELLWGIKAAVSKNEMGQFVHRVKRSHKGSIERGYQWGRPPFGYLRRVHVDEAGDAQGTHWVIDPVAGPVVHRIFELRAEGHSYRAICRLLNTEGHKPHRAKLWTARSVQEILRRSTYAGVYVTRYAGQEIQAMRPELAIVDYALWSRVQPATPSNPAAPSRDAYGSPRYWFSNLMTCEHGHRITHTSSQGNTYLRCQTCTDARKTNPSAPVPVFLSSHLAQAVLQHVLALAFTPERVQAFHERLRLRMAGGQSDEVAQLRTSMVRLDRAITRLTSTLAFVEDESAVATLQREIAQHSVERTALAAQLARIEAGLTSFQPGYVESQLRVDPRTLVGRLFECTSPHLLRAVLQRLFPSIRVTRVYGQGAHVLRWDIQLAAGEFIASQSNTPVLDSTTEVYVIVTRGKMGKRSIPAIFLADAEGHELERLDDCKLCWACNRVKSLTEFATMPSRPGLSGQPRYHGRCRVCDREVRNAQAARARDKSKTGGYIH